MQNVDARFHELVAQSAPTTRILLWFYPASSYYHDYSEDDFSDEQDAELLVYSQGDTSSDGRIAQDGIKFTNYFNKETELTIGGTVCSTVSVQFLNDDGGMNNFDYDRLCKIFIDVQDPSDGTWHSCPIGIYRFEKPSKRRDQIINTTGYDIMQYYDVEADDWWNAIDFTSGKTYLSMIQSGLNAASNNGAPAIYAAAGDATQILEQFTARPFESVQLTSRDIFGKICEAVGCIGLISSDGFFVPRFFRNAVINNSVYTINADALGSGVFSINVAEYNVPAVDKLKAANSDLDFGLIVGTGTNAYVITDNPFLYSEDSQDTPEDKVTDIYNRLNGFGAYTPIVIDAKADWSIQSGDVINVVYGGTTYRLPIFQQTLTYRGGFVRMSMWSTGSESRPTLSAQNRSEFRGQKTVHELQITSDSLVSRINDFNGSGSTIEQTINGINTTVSGKVGYDEVISSINQTPEQITIDASKISLLGYVTVNNGFSIDQNGYMTANGATINGSLSADGTYFTVIVEEGTINVQSKRSNSTVARITGGRLFDGQTGQYIGDDGDIRLTETVNGALTRIRPTSFSQVSQESNTCVSIITTHNYNNTENGEIEVRKYDSNGDVEGYLRLQDDIMLYDSGLSGTGQSITQIERDGALFGGVGSAYTPNLFDVQYPAKFPDTTITGVLDVTQRRCYATMSSTGWYRVLANRASERAGQAFEIELTINRAYGGSNNETHRILLQAVWDNITFVSEQSLSNVLGIDKIRYTYTSGVGYIDIHYALSTSNIVSVDFDVSCRSDLKSQFTAESLQSVADAPNGETVLTEYELSADGIEELTYSAWGKQWLFRRVGKLVFVESGEDGTNAVAGYETVATLPSRFAPKETKYQPIQNLHQNAGYYGWAQIYATGVFRVYISVAKSSAFNAAISFCYLTK